MWKHLSLIPAVFTLLGCYAGTGQMAEEQAAAGKHDGSGGAGSGSAGGAGTASSGGSGTGELPTDPDFDGGTDTPPVVPFDPLPVAAQVSKVKTVLTGLAPTSAEVESVTQDPKALRTLIDAWTRTPQYQEKIQLFFDDAFQQSQARAQDFRSVIDDGRTSPNDGLFLNMKQMFSRTMAELIRQGRPFTEAATTQRYMMTTALMTYYAYADSSLMTDTGGSVNRFLRADPKWSWTVTAKGPAISAADSGNPASPNYLKFYEPKLPTLFEHLGQPQAEIDYCAKQDPQVFTNTSSFALGGAQANWLLGLLSGGNFWYVAPPLDPKTATKTVCYGTGGPNHFLPSDYTDWRLVTVSQVKDLPKQTRFFDLIGNRKSSALNLFTPRLGYFTTPSFFSQYPTNISNQARGIANQTLIVGLGRAVDGADKITVRDAVGLDPAHASNAACFQCHWTLDPLRHFFRSTYTLSYSPQEDSKETSVPGTFLFDNAVGTGHTIYDLGSGIATHPRFKIAWTQKLCSWANSVECAPEDPELLRIAGLFADSQYDFRVLVRELFSSPLVTYAASTLTTQKSGAPVAIARRVQLCATIGNRLGIADLCGLQALQGADCNENCAKAGSVPAVANSIPSDGYSRGAVGGLYVNDPDPFYRSAIEQVCAVVADQVVDGKALPAGFSSADPKLAVADIVHRLLGLTPGTDEEPIAILNQHYDDAITAKSTPSIALKSTFVAACMSPWVISVGQGI